jgi:hypothetical protein
MSMTNHNEVSGDATDIIGVWSEYARCVDSLDYDALDQLFTPDVVWGSSLFGKAEGRQEIRKLFQQNQMLAAGGDASKKRPWAHVMTNPWVKINGDNASGKFYMNAYFLEGPERTPKLVALGDYHVEFLFSDGHWRIRSVHLDVFSAPDA